MNGELSTSFAMWGTPKEPLGFVTTCMPKRKPRENLIKIRGKVVDMGYAYVFDKQSVGGNKLFWRCERKIACPARIHTCEQTGEVLKRMNEHNHPPNFDLVDAEPPRKRIKEQEESPTESAMERIYSDTLMADSTVKEEPIDNSFTSFLETPIFSGPTVDEDFIHSANRTPPNYDVGAAEFSPNVHEDEQDKGEADELMQRLLRILQKELIRNKMRQTIAFSSEVATFLRENRFTSFVAQLSNFSMEDLLALSCDECMAALEDPAEGVRLFHALKRTTAPAVFDAPTRPLRIFISNDGGEVFKMLSLKYRTLQELREGMAKRGLLEGDDSRVVCMKQKNMAVEVCDEIMEEWEDEAQFFCNTEKDHLIIVPYS